MGCVPNISNTIITIRKDLLIERITLLKSDKIALIEKAIRFALGME